ncbi:MAG: Hsp20/alpha crystallin family protein [Acidobacteria bacterium]|nr:Hsp20/alpha crystallin family protein [Acidobacteriota bacterium]
MSQSRPKMIPAANVNFDRAELRRLQMRVERLFSVFEEALEFEGTKSFNSFSPNVDLCETDSSILIYVELPGFDCRDINLNASAKEISIEGEKRHSASTQKAISHYCCERQYGMFKRVINLRWSINIAECSASLADGILLIQLPKLDDRRGKTVNIPIKDQS